MEISSLPTWLAGPLASLASLAKEFPEKTSWRWGFELKMSGDKSWRRSGSSAGDAVRDEWGAESGGLL